MFLRLALLIGFVAASTAASAQGVFLTEREVGELLTAQKTAAVANGVPMAGAAVANGAQVTARVDHGTPEGGPPVRYRLGRVSSLFLVVTALHLVEQGHLSLDDPVNDHLPPAFQLSNRTYGPVRVRHLFTQTGGFARPEPSLFTKNPANVGMSRAAAGRHVARWRSPGRAPDFDPVGLALLAEVVAGAYGKAYPTALDDLVLAPLGLRHTGLLREPSPSLADCVITPDDCLPLQPRSFLAPVLGMTASLDDLATFAAALTRRDYPSRRSRDWLFERQAGLNPGAPGFTGGMRERDLQGRRALSLASNEAGAKAAIDILPPQGIAVVSVAATAVDTSRAVDVAATRFVAETPLKLATRFVPPNRETWPPAAGEPLADNAVGSLLGRYAPADGSPALSFAMFERPLQSLAVRRAPDRAEGSAPRLMLNTTAVRPQGTGVYRSSDGWPAVFGTGEAEGFLRWHGELYVTAPIVSDPLLMTLPVLIATALMATLAVYLLHPLDAQWLRFARIGLVGFFFYLMGVGLDSEYWSTVYLDWGAGWLVVVWRLLFTVGLTMLMAVPIMSAQLVRKATLPQGAAAPVVLLHLVVVSAAALVLVLTSLAWGYAADLTP